MKTAVPASLILACSHPAPPSLEASARQALAYVVDPWGTAIEMTEYLAPDTH